MHNTGNNQERRPRADEAPGYKQPDPGHGPNFGPGWNYTREPQYAYAQEYASSYGYGGNQQPTNERAALEQQAAQLRSQLQQIEHRLQQLRNSPPY